MLYKRGWIEYSDEKRIVIIDHIKSMAHQSDLRHQVVATKLLFALISGISAGKTTAMQMPLEFHARVKDAFFHRGLREAATVAFGLLMQAATRYNHASDSGGPLSLLTGSLELCVEILNCDFSADEGDTLRWNVVASRTQNCMIHPGEQW